MHGAKTLSQSGKQAGRAEVAVVCSDSVSYLYQLAGKHRYAERLMAARIEAMTREVASRSGGRLEAVPLGEPGQVPGDL